VKAIEKDIEKAIVWLKGGNDTPQSVENFLVSPLGLSREQAKNTVVEAQARIALESAQEFVSESVQAAVTVSAPVAPEWNTPAHGEIDLATADPDALGIDQFGSEADSQLYDAIQEAKRAKEAQVLEQYKTYISSIFKPEDTICFVTIEHSKDRSKEKVVNEFVRFEDCIKPEYFAYLQKTNDTASTVSGNSKPSVYVAMNAYPERLVGQRVGRTQENVLAIRALYDDIDKDGQATVNKLNSSESIPQPPIVLESSLGKFQGIWPVEGMAKDEAKALLRAMAQDFGTDTAVAETARVLRVPGLRNHKYVEAPLVTVVRMENKRYSRVNFKLSIKTKEFEKKPEGWLDAPFIHGNIDNQIVAFAGHYISAKNINDPEELYTLLAARIEKNGCFEMDGVTPRQCNMNRVREIAESKVKIWKTGEQIKKENTVALTIGGQPMGVNPDVTQPKTIEEASAFAKAEEELRQREGQLLPGDIVPDAKPSLVAEMIPAFDDTVITGVFRDVVDLATEGTTMPRQFAFLAAKVFVGARLSVDMQFEGVDGDSSYYGTAIGLTGTGKGLAWRRTIEKILAPRNIMDKGLKLFTDVDSGAGLRDSFFESPKNHPVLLYIDEVTALGHKAGEKKNPEIIDSIVTLANSVTVTRMKSKKGAKDKDSIRTHDNAHLSVYMCGQDGEAYMSSFPGKTKIGLWDRFYPEFSEPVEAGKLPDIDAVKAGQLLTRTYSMPFSGKMTMNDNVKMQLEMFWKAQPAEVRTKVRFKTYLMLDMYLAAWSLGRMVAQIDDLDVAIRMFQRQLVIRREHFKGEIPDRVGYYVGLLKKIVEAQRSSLNRGEAPSKVAMSLRDYQTDTHAFRDNEVQTFMQAWRVFNEQHMARVMTQAKNGQMYEKYLPMPFEDEYWLPQEQLVKVRGREQWVAVV
jgi:hypothetical protein